MANKDYREIEDLEDEVEEFEDLEETSLGMFSRSYYENQKQRTPYSDMPYRDEKGRSWVSDREREKEAKQEAKKAKRKMKEEFEDLEGAEESDELEEGTRAADSLKPNSNSVSDPKSKVEMMKSVIGAMGSMEKSDLVDFFNQVQSLYGPGKDWGVGDKSGSNQATLKMKPSDAGSPGANVKMPMPKLAIKEDVAELFEGQDLSEEFKDKIANIFEAAIHARIVVETTRLEEEYEEMFNQRFEEINEELVSKLDTYLDFVAENWMRDNEVAIESSLRNELMDDFIDGLKGLFAEHYIEMPEEKVDIVESLIKKVDLLEGKLDEMIVENVSLKTVVNEDNMRKIFEEVASDLAMTQQEKFAALAEGLEFDGSIDTFREKLEIIKDKYFRVESGNHEYDSGIETETFEGEMNEQVVHVDPSVNRYVQAIARTVKSVK